jgi:hypothetical protein
MSAAPPVERSVAVARLPGMHHICAPAPEGKADSASLVWTRSVEQLPDLKPVQHLVAFSRGNGSDDKRGNPIRPPPAERVK